MKTRRAKTNNGREGVKVKVVVVVVVTAARIGGCGGINGTERKLCEKDVFLL